ASGTDTHEKTESSAREREGQEKRLRATRFSIGFAPLTSITESDAQISGGETRQDYKDPRRFPLVAPSCALLFLPFGLPMSFRSYGRGFSFHA
ncbi:plasmid replication initiation protein, partial [Salmonella enterica subsp. enterica serovar Javiana]